MRKNKYQTNIKYQFLDTDGKRVLTITEDMEQDVSNRIYGVTITPIKYRDIKKVVTFDHILLSYEKLNRIASYVKSPEKAKEPLYIECECMCEILRISYDAELNEFEFSIYDSYFLKLNQKKYCDYISIPTKVCSLLNAKLVVNP